MSTRRYRIRTAADFGRTLAEARLYQGLTQEQLARRDQVERTYLARIEAGHTVLQIERPWDLRCGSAAPATTIPRIPAVRCYIPRRMLATVTTPYTDTRAGQLCLRLGLPPQVAVDVLEVTLPAGAMEIRLLGASHQVRILAGEVAFSELVACGDGTEPELPSYTELPLGALTYKFRSETTLHPPARLAGISRRIKQRFAANPHAIVGVFPGSPHAVTAVATDARRNPSWRSWHLYPQSGEVVVTRATLMVRR